MMLRSWIEEGLKVKDVGVSGGFQQRIVGLGSPHRVLDDNEGSTFSAPFIFNVTSSS